MCECSPTAKALGHIVILNVAVEATGAFRRRMKEIWMCFSGLEYFVLHVEAD